MAATAAFSLGMSSFCMHGPQPGPVEPLCPLPTHLCAQRPRAGPSGQREIFLCPSNFQVNKYFLKGKQIKSCFLFSPFELQGSKYGYSRASCYARASRPGLLGVDRNGWDLLPLLGLQPCPERAAAPFLSHPGKPCTSPLGLRVMQISHASGRSLLLPGRTRGGHRGHL